MKITIKNDTLNNPTGRAVLFKNHVTFSDKLNFDDLEKQLSSLFNQKYHDVFSMAYRLLYKIKKKEIIISPYRKIDSFNLRNVDNPKELIEKIYNKSKDNNIPA